MQTFLFLTQLSFAIMIFMPSLLLLRLEHFLYCPVWFLALAIKMYEDEQHSVTLMVTRLDCTETWVGRTEAYDWATAIVRHTCQSSGATWKGELKTVIPVKSVVNGFVFKFILIDVPEDIVQSVLRPGLENKGVHSEKNGATRSGSSP